jgi:hypothetical protein
MAYRELAPKPHTLNLGLPDVGRSRSEAQLFMVDPRQATRLLTTSTRLGNGMSELR